MQMIIEPTGDAHCIYDEAIDLHSLGRIAVRRASHVEPTNEGRWTADMEPVGGPVLGPFTRRSDALTAEQQWLVMQDLAVLSE